MRKSQTCDTVCKSFPIYQPSALKADGMLLGGAERARFRVAGCSTIVGLGGTQTSVGGCKSAAAAGGGVLSAAAGGSVRAAQGSSEENRDEDDLAGLSGPCRPVPREMASAASK